MNHNPIVHYNLYKKRSNWRFGAAIGLTVLTYSPLIFALMMILTTILGGLFMVASLPFLAYLENPDKAKEEASILIAEVRQEMADLTSTDIYNFMNDRYDDLTEIIDELAPGSARFIFYAVVGFCISLITLFAPMLSASLISGERERQTLDVLMITLLSFRSIIIGKLFSALIYVLMPVGAVWTFLMVCLALRGVTLIEVIVALLMLIVTAVAFTTIGLFISSLTKTITTTMMVIYGVVLPSLFIAPPLLMFPVSLTMAIFNISSTVIDFYGWGAIVCLNPLAAGFFSVAVYESENSMFFGTINNTPFVSPWLIYIVFYSLLSRFLLWVSSQQLERLSNVN